MRFALAAAALVALASTAHAQNFPNPLYSTYSGDVAVIDVNVAYVDGVLRGHSDRAAESFVENRFSAERRAEFEAFATPRGLTNASYGERVAEYLAEQNLRSRLSERAPGARRVNISVSVDEARVNGLVMAAVGGNPFPRLAMSFSVTDAYTGAALATGQIANSLSWDTHLENAATRTNLDYNFSGTDTNFRLLAGTTDALAQNVLATLFHPSFSTEHIELSSAPVHILVPPPRYSINVVAQ